MKRSEFIGVIAFIFFGLFNSKAQNQNDGKQVIISLSPIVIENGKYFYDGRRVKFEEVVMPLIVLNDEKVNRKIKWINTLRDTRRFIAPAPLLFLLYNMSSQQKATNNFDENRNLLWGSVAMLATFEITISLIKRSAVNRYNSVVLRPSAQIISNQLNVGLSMRF